MAKPKPGVLFDLPFPSNKISLKNLLIFLLFPFLLPLGGALSFLTQTGVSAPDPSNNHCQGDCFAKCKMQSDNVIALVKTKINI